jgi:elongation factor G
MGTKLNFIDAPGYLDFLGEATTALHTADAAVIVLSGVSGVEVGTEKVWEICDQLHRPRIIFVSQMDKERADFERVFDDVKGHLSPKVVPVEIPVAAPTSAGSSTSHLHHPGVPQGTKNGEFDEVPLPEDKDTYTGTISSVVE